MSGCASLGAGPDDAAPPATSDSLSAVGSGAPEPSVTDDAEDPDTPTSWGPTLGELDEARAASSA